MEQSCWLKNAGDEDIITYCLLDSDYHDDEEINGRYKEAKKNGINLKIWKRKELENYLLVPSVIHRIIDREGIKPIAINEVAGKIDEIGEEMKSDYLNSTMDKIHLENRRKGNHVEPSTARKKAEQEVEKLWKFKLDRLPGKDLVKRLSTWSNKEFHVSLNPLKIAQEMRRNEVPQEIKIVLSKVEHKQRFDI